MPRNSMAGGVAMLPNPSSLFPVGVFFETDAQWTFGLSNVRMTTVLVAGNVVYRTTLLFLRCFVLRVHQDTAHGVAGLVV